MEKQRFENIVGLLTIIPFTNQKKEGVQKGILKLQLFSIINQIKNLNKKKLNENN